MWKTEKTEIGLAVKALSYKAKLENTRRLRIKFDALVKRVDQTKMKLSKARLSNEPESVSGKIAAEYSILRDALNNLETQLREAAEETSRAKDAWVSIYSFKIGSSNPPSESDLARICEKYKGKCKISLGRKGKRSSFEFPKSEAADHREESKMKPSNLNSWFRGCHAPPSLTKYQHKCITSKYVNLFS